MSTTTITNQTHYLSTTLAFIRGQLGLPVGDLDDAEVLQRAKDAEVPLYKFKRTQGLPRVRKVLGVLKGLQPTSLMDVGSQRGAFLWPLLDTFPELPVTTLEISDHWFQFLSSVTEGGVDRLEVLQMDVRQIDVPDDHWDVVTFLEVLEHLERPQQAVAEALRVARRFVVFSVPSRPDDNPEHIHLFSRDTLTELLTNAGAARVTIDYVHNHMIACAKK